MNQDGDRFHFSSLIFGLVAAVLLAVYFPEIKSHIGEMAFGAVVGGLAGYGIPWIIYGVDAVREEFR